MSIRNTDLIEEPSFGYDIRLRQSEMTHMISINNFAALEKAINNHLLKMFDDGILNIKPIEVSVCYEDTLKDFTMAVSFGKSD